MRGLRKSLAIGAGCAALGAALSGGVVAFAQDTRNDTFYACAKDSSLVKPDSIRVNRTPTCGSRETVVRWSETGPQGDPGQGGTGAIVTSIIGQPSTGDPAVYYDAVLQLEPGTWQVEGSGDASDCLPLSVRSDATIEHQYYPSNSALSPQALVTVPSDGEAGVGEVVFSCYGVDVPGDFTTQLLAIPVSVQTSP